MYTLRANALLTKPLNSNFVTKEEMQVAFQKCAFEKKLFFQVFFQTKLGGIKQSAGVVMLFVMSKTMAKTRGPFKYSSPSFDRS